MKQSHFLTMNVVKLSLAFICLLWFGVISIRATDRYVVPTNALASSPYISWGTAATNIQDAVNVTVDGDTVWLTNGTYSCQGATTYVLTNWGTGNIPYTNNAMVVITNAITVRSFSGNYSNTIVNGNYNKYTNKVFMIGHAGAVVSGLTITNGYLSNWDSTRYLQPGGAGVYMRGGLLTNCLIIGNIAASIFYGSGVCVDPGIVSHCIIRKNPYAYNAPGVLVASSSWPGPKLLTNCVIDYNTCGYSTEGQAAVILNGGVTMTWCTVSCNTAIHGIRNLDSQNVVDHCIINSNSNDGVAEAGPCIYRNCLIANNGRYGVKRGSTAESPIESCTIVNNSSNGIYAPDCSGSKAHLVLNTIISGNGFDGTNNWYSTNVFYTNCCTYPMPALGTGNIANAPSFVDTNAGNYRLSSGSPCINAGLNQNWMTDAVDLDGGKRIFYRNVDIGAYEYVFQGTLYYVR